MPSNNDYYFDPMDDEAPGPYERAKELSGHEDVLTYANPAYLNEQELRDRTDFAEHGPMPIDRQEVGLKPFEPMKSRPKPGLPGFLEKGPMGPMREPLTLSEFDQLSDSQIRKMNQMRGFPPSSPDKHKRPSAFWMDKKGVHEWYEDGRRTVTPPEEWLKRNPKADTRDRQAVIKALQERQKPGTGNHPLKR